MSKPLPYEVREPGVGAAHLLEGDGGQEGGRECERERHHDGKGVEHPADLVPGRRVDLCVDECPDQVHPGDLGARASPVIEHGGGEDLADKKIIFQVFSYFNIKMSISLWTEQIRTASAVDRTMDLSHKIPLCHHCHRRAQVL